MTTSTEFHSRDGVQDSRSSALRSRHCAQVLSLAFSPGNAKRAKTVNPKPAPTCKIELPFICTHSSPPRPPAPKTKLRRTARGSFRKKKNWRPCVEGHPNFVLGGGGAEQKRMTCKREVLFCTGEFAGRAWKKSSKAHAHIFFRVWTPSGTTCK